MSAPTGTPTQVRHPWRASVRTGLAAAIGLASLLPLIVAGLHYEAVPGVAQVLGVAIAINRLMAVPGVNEWLTGIGLGPTPKQ